MIMLCYDVAWLVEALRFDLRYYVARTTARKFDDVKVEFQIVNGKIHTEVTAPPLTGWTTEQEEEARTVLAKLWDFRLKQFHKALATINERRSQEA